ncbi:MAG: hypothetical protein LBU12_00780 [Deltaproteobacteria bacterium]|jgi:hypothetical protein|nr:hypothetical protein [Deltaproteobacteria bacterium]
MTGHAMASAACFDHQHLIVLDSAAHLAGELISEAYGLNFYDFRQWPVDVRHYPQLSEAEKRTDVLAQLFRYARGGPDASGGRSDYWRVCLYDPAILAAVNRESVGLYPLLCYVLTHEFLHVARFARFIELFSLDPAQRAHEEAAVHQETEKLLAKVVVPGLPAILKLYQNNLLSIDETLEQ